MGGETVEATQFVDALLEAARNEDWDKVDDELVPQLSKLDGNQMASKLLRHVDDENPDVRDVVATAFSGLEGLTPEIEEEVAKAMFKMVGEDEERYPAGRAMTYLLTLQDKPRFRDRVSETLTEFKARAEELDWVPDLKEAIPALADIL